MRVVIIVSEQIFAHAKEEGTKVGEGKTQLTKGEACEETKKIKSASCYLEVLFNRLPKSRSRIFSGEGSGGRKGGGEANR